jgi:CheY-like chemotaxis protein
VKVLVVDDAAEVIEAVTVSFTLQWRETDVIGADNGELALDLIEQEHPDVVLLDIAMPGMDGFETLRQIRLFSDVPVIMLTARDDVIDKVKDDGEAAAHDSEAGTGVGLRNVCDRLNTRYGPRSGCLSGPDPDGGYTVHLYMPVTANG